MNWGLGIGIFYSLFVIVLLGFVFWSLNYTPDLVTEDYYEHELNYQNTINDKNRAKNLEGDVVINNVDGRMNIDLPESLKEKNISGELYLFRPSDKNLDTRYSFKGKSLSYSFDSEELKKGTWKAKISWEADGNNYFHEETVSIY